MTNTYKFNRLYLLVMSAIAMTLLYGCTSTRLISKTTLQTCHKCGSTRKIKTDASVKGLTTIMYKSPTFAACSHKWEDGINNSVEPSIPDKQIVLVKKGNTIGAFIPMNQNTGPEGLSFNWYYRNDGKGTFRHGESGSFVAGESSRTAVRSAPFNVVGFGPFNIEWYGNSPGMGTVNYQHLPGEPISPDDIRICTTTETDITKVDAADKKWIYKGSPTDRGVHADGKAVP